MVLVWLSVAIFYSQHEELCHGGCRATFAGHSAGCTAWCACIILTHTLGRSLGTIPGEAQACTQPCCPRGRGSTKYVAVQAWGQIPQLMLYSMQLHKRPSCTSLRLYWISQQLKRLQSLLMFRSSSLGARYVKLLGLPKLSLIPAQRGCICAAACRCSWQQM